MKDIDVYNRYEVNKIIDSYIESENINMNNPNDMLKTISYFVEISESRGYKTTVFTNPIMNKLPYKDRYEREFYSQCVDTGINMLSQFQELAPELTAKIHKGTPYYWMAISSYMCHDFDTAIFFFNLAAQEDIRDGGEIKIDKEQNTIDAPPALLFMLLDKDNPRQAAIPITDNAVRIFNHLLDNYNGLQKVTFSLEDMRAGLLLPSITDKLDWQTIVSSFIGFVIEYDFRLQIISLEKTTINSGSSIYLLHILKGCVILESLLKNNPLKTPQPPRAGSYTTLKRDIMELQAELNISCDSPGNSLSVDEVIEQMYTDIIKNVSDLFMYSIKIRNALAHNLYVQQKLTKENYELLINCIINACFHTINMLYPRE